MVQRTADTYDSINELLEALAAGQRLLVSEQRQIQKQLDRLEATVQDMKSSFDSIEACLERIEQTTQPEHDDQSNVSEQLLRQ